MNIAVLVVKKKKKTHHIIPKERQNGFCLVAFFKRAKKEMSPSSQEAPHLAALASAELHAHFLPYPSYRKLSHVDWFRLMLVERIESRNGALSSSPHPHGSYTMDIGVTTSIHIIIFTWKSKTPSFTPKIRLASIIFCTSLITAILLYGLVYCIFYFFY